MQPHDVPCVRPALVLDLRPQLHRRERSLLAPQPVRLPGAAHGGRLPRRPRTNCTAQLKICGRRALLFLPMLPLILFYYPLAIAASPIVMAIRPSCEDVPPAHMVLKSMFIDPFEDSCAGVKWTLLGLVCLPLLPLLPIVCLVSYTCCKRRSTASTTTTAARGATTAATTTARPAACARASSS